MLQLDLVNPILCAVKSPEISLFCPLLLVPEPHKCVEVVTAISLTCTAPARQWDL